ASAISSTEKMATRILVITGGLTNGSTCTEERATQQLIRSLNSQCRHTEFTVLATERSRLARGGWQAQGVRVSEGPLDWAARSVTESGSFSHVVVTASALRSPARRWLEVTQPQAAKVLFLPSLPFREVTALAPITRVDEIAGLEFTRVKVE